MDDSRPSFGRCSLNSGMNAESPMGRIARPDEIAASILYLSSEAAGIVTGTNLTIDGGSMASS